MTMLIKVTVSEISGRVTVYNGAWRKVYKRHHVNNSTSALCAVFYFLHELYGIDWIKDPKCVPDFTWCKDHSPGKYIYIFPSLDDVNV